MSEETNNTVEHNEEAPNEVNPQPVMADIRVPMQVAGPSLTEYAAACLGVVESFIEEGRAKDTNAVRMVVATIDTALGTLAQARTVLLNAVKQDREKADEQDKETK